MVDVFEEVEDELRTEQYKRLALRSLPWVAAALVAAAVVFGAWYGLQEYNARKAAQAGETYQAAIESYSKGDLQTAYNQFGEVAKNGPGPYKSLALQVQGGLRLRENRVKDAVALFDASAKAAPGGAAGALIGDAARLKSALALLDDAPYADIEARLKPLIEDGRPYRPLALETLALAKLRAGKLKEARADFESLKNALDAPQGMIERANSGIALIDSGAASTVAAVVKAAQAAPAMPMMMPNPQGSSPQGPGPGGSVQ